MRFPLLTGAGRWGARVACAGVLCAGLLGAPPAYSQVAGRPPGDQGAMEPPPLSRAVSSLLEQDYLSAAERRDLRVRHGLWEEADLGTPAHRAQAALIRGAWSDESFADESIPALDRAAAALRRGEPERALVLAGGEGLRATRLRAEALLDVGRREEARALLRDAAPRAVATPVTVEDAVEGVQCLILRARLEGPGTENAGDYRRMMAALAVAREQIDKLAWRVPLAEARLLYAKDNYPEAAAAVREALTLNPRLAEAWALLGELAVDSFDMPRAEAIAARLDELAAPSPSPEGAAVRARARIRLSDGKGALEALVPAIGAFPGSRPLMAARAAATAATFDFDATRARLAELEAVSPGSPAGYMEVGRAMSNARQYDEAAEYLGEAAARAPYWTEAWIELGLSQLQAGRLGAAEEALARAEKIDTFNTRAANSLILLREIKSYATIESDHFIVRFKPGVDLAMAAEMPAVLERIYARVTGDQPGGIRHEPAHKTAVELYPDHRWFGVRITGMPALHTIAAATGPVIAMEPPREGPGHMAGPYDWARVVQHEFTHTVTLSRTKNRLPHWFTEASAQYLEDCPRDYSTVLLLARASDTDGFFDLDSINTAFVRPRRPTDRALAYAQGHFMYEYMIERYGPEAPLALMDLYASGVREAEAFDRVMHTPRDRFLEDFKAWARERLVSWGMLSGPGRPDINDLMAGETPESEDPSAGPTQAVLRRWLDSYPDNPFVLEAAVKSILRRSAGKPGPGDADVLRRYAAARPVDPLPHKLLASILLAEGDGSGAVPHLEYLDAREQHTPSYAMELAKRYLAAGDTDRAAAKAARATQIAPYDPGVREFAATMALRLGDLAGAERHINALILLEPDRPVHKQRLDAIRKMKGG